MRGYVLYCKQNGKEVGKMERITYETIYSDRRTMALQIKDGRLIVRAPKGKKAAEIRSFVESNRAWIEKHLSRVKAREQTLDRIKPLTASELTALANAAAKDIPRRVSHYAAMLGVTYGRITIRNQRTRWGSCSAEGNLNFNCLLMLAPPEVRDSVVVHELCHRKEMNHSAKFYAAVLSVYPEYRRHHAWLKTHGDELMRRIKR